MTTEPEAPASFDPLRMTVSLSQKVQIAPYETADCSLFISGLTVYSTTDEMEALIGQSHLAYKLMAERLHGMVKEARHGQGWGEEEEDNHVDEVPFDNGEPSAPHPAAGTLRDRLGVPPGPAWQGNGRTATQAAQASRGASNAVVCAECGGPTWDNRAKISAGTFNERSPHFSCKNKEGCGFAAWPAKDGGLRWSGPKG